jgi:nicotinamide-nucleotide amidase
VERDLSDLSAEIGAACLAHHIRLATAESCTGGWAAQVITHTAGSSEWFDRGFVTYSNAAKNEQLGVPPETLTQCGAVSLETAAAMASGAIKNSNALFSISITGIAGPTGGSLDKPVGTVCFGWCRKDGEAVTETQHFTGDRETIRRQAVIHSLRGLLARIDST